MGGSWDRPLKTVVLNPWSMLELECSISGAWGTAGGAPQVCHQECIYCQVMLNKVVQQNTHNFCPLLVPSLRFCRLYERRTLMHLMFLLDLPLLSFSALLAFTVNQHMKFAWRSQFCFAEVSQSVLDIYLMNLPLVLRIEPYHFQATRVFLHHTIGFCHNGGFKLCVQ